MILNNSSSLQKENLSLSLSFFKYNCNKNEVKNLKNKYVHRALNEKLVYETNEKKKIGIRDDVLDVSPMGVGTWSWGNKFLWDYNTDMDPELQEIFNLAVANGINLFDTADSYGTGQLNGRSELLLGKFIKEYNGSDNFRNNIHIATKFAAYPWRIFPNNIVKACKGSIRRLGTEKVSLGQLHWSTANYAPLQEIALQNGLINVYKEGLVKAVGVSNYGPVQLEKIYEQLKKENVPLSSAQIQFSLLSYEAEQKDLLQLCQELNIAIISYSPLALGLLTGKISEKGPFPKGPRKTLFKSLLPKIQPLLNLLKEIAKSKKKTQSQIAINWCISKGTIPIPGAKTIVQMKDNLGALGWLLSNSEIEALDQCIATECKGKMIQNIFQTK